MFCKFCGLKLPADALFCVGCGAPTEPTAADKNVAAKTRPGGNVPQRGLVGWSDKCNHPEIIAAAQKNKKSAIGCAYVLTLLFPIGFFIAGLLVDELPLGEAVIIGAGLGLFMLLINLMRVRDMKKQIWDGVVIEKYQKERREYDKEDNVSYYTDYVLVIQKDTGKKVRLVNKNRRELYDYINVKDRVRYHPAFSTYEKYDKSKDKIIYCNVCSTMNPMGNERCKRCNNLLFK